VTVIAPEDVTGPPDTLMPVPAVRSTLVTVPVFEVKPLGFDAGYAPRFVSAVAASVAPVPPLTTATTPVTFPAVPVVFWLSVGTSAATIARNVGTPAEPFGAARTVLAVCDAKSDGVTARVPPSVSEPVDVTVPLRLRPLTVPVPETDVTVPTFDVKPEGLLAGYAPRFVRAVAASVAPVPPLATARVPPSVIVPDPVIGPPEVVKPVVPPLTSTDVTEPPPAVDAMVIVPLPFVTVMPDPAVSVALVRVLPVLLPISNCPSVYVV
jgi:hypothetical protein